MSLCDLSNKRILLTQASDFMGPALQRTLENCGAEIIADTSVSSSEHIKLVNLFHVVGEKFTSQYVLFQVATSC